MTSSSPTGPGVRWPSLWSWIVLALATIALCWPLIGNPTMPRASDTSYHSQWAHGFIRALSEGALYPRWVDEANRGFGAPVFIFYPPLSYYMVAACSLATGSVVEAIRLTLILAAFLSGLSFFLSQRGVGSELGAAIGAALYVLLPYHALDLYERFALAEYTGFIFFPLVFWAARSLSDRFSWGAWFGLAASFAGLILTHLMSGYMIAFVLGPYLFVRLRRSGNWSSLIPMASAVLAAALCCAVYLVPFLVQRPFVHLDWFDTDHYNWRRNFIYRDEVAFGFKFDVVKPWSTWSSSTQALLAFALAGLLLLQQRRLRGTARQGAPQANLLLEGWTHFGLALWTWFLQTPLSTPIWATVPQLGASQFPWRFAQFQLFSASCMTVAVLSLIESAVTKPDDPMRRRVGKSQKPSHTESRVPVTGLLPALAWRLTHQPLWSVAVIGLAAGPALWISSLLTASRPWDFNEQMAQTPAYRYRVVKEFLPRGAENWQQWESVPYPERREGLRDAGQVQELAWTTEARRIRVDTPKPNRLVLITFDYPGWQATVDGKPVQIVSDNAANTIEVPVPAGIHDVEVVFTPTWDRRLGAAISAGSALLILGLGVWALRRRRG